MIYSIPVSKRTMLFALIVSLSIFIPNVSADSSKERVSEWGYITGFSTGWVEDSMAVYHTKPIVSTLQVTPTTIKDAPLHAAPCDILTAGYITEPADSGHKLHHAAIIAAYLHHKQVRFTVLGCYNGKPKIISVELKD
ncbi:MAG: hypothetical protein ACXVJ5_11110 [Flavisolibacter sp.]|jgi:hypothetical protein